MEVLDEVSTFFGHDASMGSDKFSWALVCFHGLPRVWLRTFLSWVHSARFVSSQSYEFSLALLGTASGSQVLHLSSP